MELHLWEPCSAGKGSDMSEPCTFGGLAVTTVPWWALRWYIWPGRHIHMSDPAYMPCCISPEVRHPLDQRVLCSDCCKKCTTQGCRGAGTRVNGVQHLFHILFWNEFEAVLKWLVFWVRSHTFFVSTISLVLCLAQVVFSYFILQGSKIALVPTTKVICCAACCSDWQMELIVYIEESIWGIVPKQSSAVRELRMLTVAST